MTYEFGKLREAFRDFRDVPQLDEVFGLENVDDAVTLDLPDEGAHAIHLRVRAPRLLDVLLRHRVEHDGRHHLGEDGAVLDKVFVVGGRTLVDHALNPIQHLVF